MQRTLKKELNSTRNYSDLMDENQSAKSLSTIHALLEYSRKIPQIF